MGRLGWTLVVGLVAGCGAPCETLWYADLDGDGFGDPEHAEVSCVAPEATVANGRDCDDLDAKVHPGAGERCNGLDDDCDGQVDLDLAVVWYLDRDADGWGDGEAPVEGCDPPPHYVATPGDCDDLTPQVHPGAIEVCNQRDDDCNGQIDDAPADPRTWYRDADGDGFGDAAQSASHCTAPLGWTEIPGDCDDGDPAIHPGAPEVCNGKDDDCDGAVDDADPDGAEDATAWDRDDDGDGVGDPATRTWGCEPPGPGWVDAS